MSRAPLRIREIALAGFGPHREGRRFFFPDGPSVLVGPNESGKSNLLQALAATLFGLPAGNDPTGFTTAHFRSIPPPREFWGEVAWESDGRRYRLHRAFDSHQVRWVEETGDRRRVVYQGEHNPQAKSHARSPYPPRLREQFGLASLDLFLEAFCLGQVASQGDDLSADLQHLLSGSRTGRTDDVLQRLFDEVKERTRATGDLGLRRPGKDRPVNQREPGRLERLEDELARARADFAAGRSGLTLINERSTEREKIAAERKALAISLEQRRGRVDTLKRWAALEEERRRHEEALLRARSQLRELDEVEAKRKAEETGRGAADAVLLEAPADLGARLEALAAAEESAAARRQEATDQEVERSRLEAEAQALQARLDGELAPVRGMEDPVRVRRELAAAIRVRDQRAAELAQVRGRITELQDRLNTEGTWPEDLDPVLLRTRADSWLQDVRRLEAIAERRAEIAGPLEGRSFLDDDRMELLRRKLGIEERLRSNRARSRELEMQAAQLAAATARAEAEVERARAAEARQLARAADARAREAGSLWSGPISPWLSLLGAAVIGPGLHYGLDLAWPAALGAGAAVFVLLQMVSFLLARARAKRLAAAPIDSSADAGLAGDAGASQPATSAAGSAPAGTAAPLSPGPASAPDPAGELAALQAEREALEASFPSIRDQLGPFADVTGPEIGRLEERWAQLATEDERLVREAHALLAAFGGTDADWRTIPVSSLPEGLRDLLRLPGAPAPETCAALAAWLSTLDDAAWARFADRATARRELADRLRQEQERLAHHEAEARHDPDPEELQRRLGPFTADTPEEELERLVRERDQAEAGLRDLRARAAQIPSEATLRERCEETARADAEARAKWRDAWPRGPEPPAAGLRPWSEEIRAGVAAAREAATRLQGRDEATTGILRAAGATDRTEIERRAVSAEATLGAARLEVERLEADDPFLSASREIRDPLERALRLRQVLEDETRLLAEENEAEIRLHRREVELSAKLDSGASGIGTNLAQLELKIRDLEAELKQVRFERDALALAFGWVSEAAERFRGTYREDLERRVSAQFAALTGRDGRRVRIDDRFRLVPVESDGSELASAQLSRGARDQLQLAVRLAVTDLLAGSVPLPLFLDDPFVHFDAERLEHLRAALGRLAESRQWILLTHRADLADWGAPVRMEAAR